MPRTLTRTLTRTPMRTSAPGAPAETPAAFVRAILLAYGRRGVDPGPALRQVGLAPQGEAEAEAVTSAVAAPDGRVALEAFEALSARAMRELDDEALGWFSRRLPWGSYGMLLRASLGAPSLEVALRRWCRHHGLLTDDVRIAAEVEDGACVVRIEERAALGALREFCLVSLLRNLHGVSCWLVDSRIALGRTDFPFAAPPWAEACARLFGEVGFGAPAVAMRFEADYLRLPVVRDDAALRRMLQRPIPLMARQYRQDRLMSRRIVRLLSAEAGPPPAAPEIAARLNISVRSLQRHLQEEGTSLLSLRAGALRLRAEALLRRGDLPLKRVAHLLGYGDEASFGRAFRSWTGETPAAYRRRGE